MRHHDDRTAAGTARLERARVAVGGSVIRQGIRRRTSGTRCRAQLNFYRAFALIANGLRRRVTQHTPRRHARVARNFIHRDQVSIFRKTSGMAYVPRRRRGRGKGGAYRPRALSRLVHGTLASAKAVWLHSGQHWYRRRSIAGRSHQGPSEDASDSHHRINNAVTTHRRNVSGARHDLNSLHRGRQSYWYWWRAHFASVLLRIGAFCL